MSDKKDKWDNDSRFVNSDGGFVIDNSEAEGEEFDFSELKKAREESEEEK